MGLFNALGRLLRPSDNTTLSENERARLLEAWGLSETALPKSPEGPATSETAAPLASSEYDRTQWERKLRTVIDGLPDSEEQWHDMLADALALGFDEEWIRDRQREEFTLLIRRAVADCRFSPQEQRKIDLARTLIGLTEDEAERIVQGVVSEAEEIFGRKVEGNL